MDEWTYKELTALNQRLNALIDRLFKDGVLKEETPEPASKKEGKR